jgi:two-component system phosphate regulon sensor histidine kinase PhoR
MASRFQQAARALPDAMVILGKGQIIEWINPMAVRLFGFNKETDIGRPITNLIRHPGFRAFLSQPGTGDEYEMQSPALSSRQLALRKVPYGANQELLIARDITRLHKLEIMRSQFVANVSHELRSPITVLSGYLETLKSSENNSPEVLRQAIGNMYTQAKRMERLVADLLELSRLETEPKLPGNTSIDVAAMLAGLVESAQILSGESRHSIKLEADPGLKLKGSQSELHSLFANLINNAVLYTPAGGSINVVWMPEGGEAVFAVTDTGPGIAPQHIPRITERFYRVDVDRSRETGGTGLGLAIVKHVVDRYDGKLEIVSELGKGSTFRCRFPEHRVERSAV